jgi:hypothetical protein
MHTSKSVLVQQITPGFLKTGDPKEVGRYAEVVPFIGKDLTKGEVATYIDSKTKRSVCGKVVERNPYPPHGTGFAYIIDTFNTIPDIQPQPAKITRKQRACATCGGKGPHTGTIGHPYR